MDLFLRIYQHLLPRSRALSLVAEKALRRLFVGLTGLPAGIQEFIDLIWLDVFPDTTRELSAWETQFGIVNPATADSDRRAALASAWNRGGNLGLDALQDALQDAGFPLFVHHSWYLTPAKAIRNPNLYLADGDTTIVFVAECGEAIAECGEPTALCGDTSTPSGILLVNKILQRSLDYVVEVTCGEALAQCGEPASECGNNTGFNTQFKPYLIPDNTDLWPYFWYVGGEIFGDSVTIPITRKQELENLVLKIGPAHLWTGLLVDYA